MRPKVSILVTNFNGTSDLALSLDALLHTDYPNLEITVVDSCTPNFDEWIKEKYPSLKYLHFSSDIGNAGQRNAGLQLVDKHSEYICFIDDDVIVTPEWLDRIITLMEDRKDIGAVQPLRFNYTVKSEIDGLGYLMTNIAFPYRVEPTEENLSKIKSNKVLDIFYAETTVMVVRYKILFQLDSKLTPFDSNHIFGWDDVDLSWRIWLLGYRVVVTSESVCYHKRDINTRRMKLYDARYMYFGTRGRYISMLKNYELSYLIKYLPIAVMVDICKCLLLLYYKPDQSITTLKGMIWGLTHFRYILNKRYDFRKIAIRKSSDLETVFVKPSARSLIAQFKYNWS